jgi:hypothetical protein
MNLRRVNCTFRGWRPRHGTTRKEIVNGRGAGVRGGPRVGRARLGPSRRERDRLDWNDEPGTGTVGASRWGHHFDFVASSIRA